jgi:hypothetical protein
MIPRAGAAGATPGPGSGPGARVRACRAGATTRGGGGRIRDRGATRRAGQPTAAGALRPGCAKWPGPACRADLALLGRVNPLALEEFAALEERYKFLSTQLEDLKSTRRDLLTVIAEVDEKILEVFTEAFHDVARISSGLIVE